MTHNINTTMWNVADERDKAVLDCSRWFEPDHRRFHVPEAEIAPTP